MNVQLREQFVGLYRRPVLEDLDASLRRRVPFPPEPFPALPERSAPRAASAAAADAGHVRAAARWSWSACSSPSTSSTERATRACLPAPSGHLLIASAARPPARGRTALARLISAKSRALARAHCPSNVAITVCGDTRGRMITGQCSAHSMVRGADKLAGRPADAHSSPFRAPTSGCTSRGHGRPRTSPPARP